MSATARSASGVLRGSIRWLAALLAFFAGSAWSVAADRAPDWLGAVRQAAVTVPVKEAAAVVLLDDILLEVSANGSFKNRVRFAVRVLTAEGSKQAVVRVPYNTDSMKMKSLQAWLIAPDGKVTVYGKRHIVDAAIHTGAMELYGEARQQVIAASADAKPGAVFGYEAVIEESSVLAQRVVRFQSTMPVERVSYAVQLPPGWRLDAHPFNQPPACVESAGRRHTWTATKLPALVLEPFAPPAPTFSPWLAIDFVPPATLAAAPRVTFASWSDISAYFSPRYEAAATGDAVMAAKAAELVRGKTDQFVRLQAIAGFVQEVNYISIQLDAANAGGMIPRPASRVFRTNYGDCKDKATLLRALLATQGIVSYPLVVQSGNTTRLREDWPSPLQFNHVILAIRVDESVKSPAVFDHPDLGRLLIFDPTNEFVPIGSLADTLLADKGVLLAGERGGLVALPAELPESNRLERRVRATLDDLGGIAGTIEEEFFGHASSGARAERRRHGENEFRRRIERWLAGTLPAAQTTRVETADFWSENRFTLATDFASAKYGKLMRDELLVFKPILVARRGAVAMRKGPRTQPVLLRPSRYTERTEITLPPGCTVEETIRPVALATAFGSYRATCAAQDGKLVFERSLDLQAAELPAGDFAAVRAFFEKILQTEQSPVVLRRARLAQAAP